MNPLRKLAGQTAIYGGSTIIARLLNYFLVPLHTRIFNPDAYGVVGEMYAYVSLLIVLLTYGMETAFFRYYETGKPDREKVYSTTMISLLFTSMLFVVLAVSFAQPIAETLRYSTHSEYVKWFAFIIAFDAVSTIPFAKLRALSRPKVFAAIKILNIGINVVLNLFFLLLCPYLLQKELMTGLINTVYSPEVGVGYIFISNLVASSFTLVLLLILVPWKKWHFNISLWRKMIWYALPLLVFGLAGIINETMDRILLKYLSPAEIASSQVGIYTACYKISIMMTIVIQGFKYAAEPFFFSHAREKNAPSLYADVMKYFVIICSVIFLAIMLYIDLVKYFVGEKYYEGLIIVPILLLANMFLGIFYNLSIWYKLTDKTRYGAYLSVFGVIITLVMNFALIPVIGYLGSAWATFSCYFLMMIASYFVGQKHYKVEYKVWRVLFYIFSSVVFYYISTQIPHINDIVHNVINTFILFLYLLMIIRLEKINLKKIIPVK